MRDFSDCISGIDFQEFSKLQQHAQELCDVLKDIDNPEFVSNAVQKAVNSILILITRVEGDEKQRIQSIVSKVFATLMNRIHPIPSEAFEASPVSIISEDVLNQVLFTLAYADAQCSPASMDDKVILATTFVNAQILMRPDLLIGLRTAFQGKNNYARIFSIIRGILQPEGQSSTFECTPEIVRRCIERIFLRETTIEGVTAEDKEHAQTFIDSLQSASN